MAVGLALMMGFVLHPELRLALPGRQHHRLLAALAHQPVDLAARLPLHPAGRQPQGRAHLRQPDDGDAAGRALGTVRAGTSCCGARFTAACWRSSARRKARRLYAGCPARAGGITFFVCLSVGVLRAKTCRQAWTTCLAVRPGRGYAANASPAAVHRRTTPPMGAGALVWGLPNTWTFTARAHRRGRWAGGAAGAVLLLMCDPDHQPFLYFQF
jgi:hypothetical protein